MGEVFKDVTDFLGLTDHEGKERAREKANEQSERANNIAEANLEYQKQQRARWERIYGVAEENVSNYINSLTAEKVIALGLQEQQRAYQSNVKQIKSNMAQRGLGDSDFENYLVTLADMDNSNRKASIRADADLKVAQQKMNFINMGLGQGVSMLNNVNNASGQATTAASNSANMYTNMLNNLNNSNSDMTRQLVDQGFEVAGKKANRNRL